MRTERLARRIHAALVIHHLFKVVDAEVIIAVLTLAAVLVVVAHGALSRAVLGLAVALAVGAVEDRVAAVAVATPAALGVERLAVLELAAGEFLLKHMSIDLISDLSEKIVPKMQVTNLS